MSVRTVPVCGFLLDSARTLERRGYYEKALTFLAERGINRVIWHFCDDQGCQLQFRSVPGIGSARSYTVNETRQLIQFAKQRGVELVPEIASLGHSRYITRLPAYQHLNENDDAYSGMCPVEPETREVIARLVRETMEIFDSAEVHVGLDEVAIGDHPLTRQSLRTRSKAQIIADHIRFVRELVVEEGGREMWMWGDGLIASDELIGLVPKDIVICNWQYAADVDQSSTQKLLDAGFDVITASAILSHDQTLFPSIDYSIKNVRAMRSHGGLRGTRTDAKVRGEIVTTWMPSRSISESQWLGWHLATHVLADGPEAPIEPAVRAFGREFHGLEQTDAWWHACLALLEGAPRRTEWMAVIKLDLNSLPATVDQTLGSMAERWRSLAMSLHQIAPDVRSNRVAFDAMQLLVDLLAHAYEAASSLSDLTASTVNEGERIHTLLETRQRLCDQLSDAWDRERYSDDPTKFHAAIRFFRDDHLLLTVRDGLGVLERRSIGLLVGAKIAGHSAILQDS